MNLGKFNNVISQLNNYYEENDIAKLYQDLIDTLQVQINSASQESVMLFRTKLDEFIDAVRDVPEYSNMATFTDVLRETGGLEFFGLLLEDSINKIIHKQFVSPLEMHLEMVGFQKILVAYISLIKKLAISLRVLAVEYDEISEGEYEFSALFPKDLIGSTIKEINEELVHIDRLFKSLNELIGKGNTSPVVKTISSSWWQFYLSLDGEQIAAMTFALERIVNLYKISLEIRKMKSEAEKLQLSEEIIVKIEAQVEAKVKQGMIEITKEIRANYQSNNDDARCNELEIQLRQELTVMAKRLNQGALYEIKAGLPNMPEEPVALAGSELGVKEVKAYENEMSEYQRKLDNVRKINAVNELIVEVSNAMIENQNILLLDYDKLKD